MVRQNEIGGLSMAKSHITGIEESDPKQGGQKDLPLASALAGIWWIRRFEEVGQTPIGGWGRNRVVESLTPSTGTVWWG